MNKLSKKTDIIIKMIKMFLSRDEVALLVDTLQQKYNLKQSPQSAPKPQTTPQQPAPSTTKPKVAPPPPQEKKSEEQTLPLEVIYSDGVQSNKKRSPKAIGVIIIAYGMRKLLYYDGSENIGTRSQAYNYIRNLPKGYNWHLMRESEAIAVKNCLEDVNLTLKQINGLPIGSCNYMLEDDGQSKGYVRYVADI